MEDKEQVPNIKETGGVEEEEEAAKEDEESVNDQDFLPSQEWCTYCAMVPCLCDLLKVEMKIKIGRKRPQEEKKEAGRRRRN